MGNDRFDELSRRRRRRKRSRRPVMRWVVLGVLVAALAGLGIFLLLGGGEPAPEPTEPEEYQVQIGLLGESQMQIGYGKAFTDPGAEAFGFGTLRDTAKVPLKVETEGEVDTSRLGVYTIRYTARYQDVTETVTRTVEVVDDVPPTIILVEDDGYTLPGQPYQDAGYTAVDEIDGDITERVERREEDGIVYYTVTDAAGNQAKAQRTVHYDDPVAPVLTLKGKEKVELTLGDAWKEPGYTAQDNVDGDLTENVEASGSVDTKKAGTYTLKYSVRDGYGNEATAKRTVVVKEAPKEPEAPTDPTDPADPTVPSEPPETTGPLQIGEPNGKTIYLTFDDGPGKYTRELLDVLAKYDVKATFFVVKTGYLELLDDIVAEGHAIGMHSVTHDYSQIYQNEETFMNDLYQMQDIICQYTGVTPTLMRFPGGSSNGISKKYNDADGLMTRLVALVEQKGFQYFDWNVNSKDAEDARTAEEVFQNVVGSIGKKQNAVVLQHDIKGFSVDAVELIIRWGLENGYTFAALTPSSPTCHHNVNN